ncbi:response regulator [Myxococcota bacterium]
MWERQIAEYENKDELYAAYEKNHRVYNLTERRVKPREIQMALAPPLILLAEDNADMRHVLARALRTQGYEVLEVKDGKELLDRIATGVLINGYVEPDLVISDIRMPGWTGLEVLGGLRTSDWAMPVILITAFGDEATHAEAKRLGAALVLDKPFDVDDLLTAVGDILPFGP